MLESDSDDKSAPDLSLRDSDSSLSNRNGQLML